MEKRLKSMKNLKCALLYLSIKSESILINEMISGTRKDFSSCYLNNTNPSLFKGERKIM